MVEDLRFTIWVNSSSSKNELLEILTIKLPEGERTGGYLRVGANVMTFEDNYNYDPDKCIGGEDDWEYCPYYLDVFYVEEVSLSGQIYLSNQICQILEQTGAKAELLDEFTE